MRWGLRAGRLVVKAAVDFLVPPACLVCDRLVAGGPALCAECWRTVHWIVPPICDRSGMPLPHSAAQSIDRLSDDPPPWRRARAVAIYQGGARHLVQAFKYADRQNIAPALANWMARAGSELYSTNPILVPVPMHWSRAWPRRMNQSALLAQGIARITGLRWDPLICCRHRRTRPQSGLSARARRRNVAGAFRIASTTRSRISGQTFLLVDDVMTTGATLRACSRVFMDAGAESVDVLTFARTMADHDGAPPVGSVGRMPNAET